MAIEFRIEGRPSTSRPTRPLRSVDSVDPDEIVRWALFLSTASESEKERGVCEDDAVRALTDVADRDEALLHRAWLVALRRLRDGDTTRRAVHLTQAALEASHRMAS